MPNSNNNFNNISHNTNTRPSDLKLNIPNSNSNLSTKSQHLVPPISPNRSYSRLDPNIISGPLSSTSYSSINNPNSPNQSVNTHSPRVHRTFHKLASSKQSNLNKYNTASPSFSNTSINQGNLSHSKSLNKDNSNSNDLIDNDTWRNICVKVLPLFNGENMITTPLEDLNNLVILHIRDTIARSKPSKVIENLSNDFNSLISNGMLTLSAKLSQHAEEGSERLINRLTEIWSFFLGQVLPYIEGVFLPYHTDQHIKALSISASNSVAKMNENKQNDNSNRPRANSGLSSSIINVRKSVLRGFRDSLILPLYSSLEKSFLELSDDVPPTTPTSQPQSKQSMTSLKSAYQLGNLNSIPDSLPSTAAAAATSHVTPTPGSTFSQFPRLQQMTLILCSIRSNDEQQKEIESLYRILRMCFSENDLYYGHYNNLSSNSVISAPSMFRSIKTNSSNSPLNERMLSKKRDRRGWIRKKTNTLQSIATISAESTDDNLNNNNNNNNNVYDENNNIITNNDYYRDYYNYHRKDQKDSEDEWLDTLRSPNESPAYLSNSATPSLNVSNMDKQRMKASKLPQPTIAPRGSSLAFNSNNNEKNNDNNNNNDADINDVSSDSDQSIEFETVQELRKEPTLLDLREDESNSEGAEYIGQRLMENSARKQFSEEEDDDDQTQETVSPVRGWSKAQKELEDMLGITNNNKKNVEVNNNGKLIDPNDLPTPTLPSNRFLKPLPPSPPIKSNDNDQLIFYNNDYDRYPSISTSNTIGNFNNIQRPKNNKMASEPLTQTKTY